MGCFERNLVDYIVSLDVPHRAFLARALDETTTTTMNDDDND